MAVEPTMSVKRMVCSPTASWTSVPRYSSLKRSRNSWWLSRRPGRQGLACSRMKVGARTSR
jgi:hypothetical protein